jgi:class 3 adenylate cyclase
MKKNILFEDYRTFDLPVEKVWDLLADSNQLNEYVGLFPIKFSPFVDDGTTLVRKSEATAFGFVKTAWTENVFEWIKYQTYKIERVYSIGPVKRAVWTVSLEPIEESKTIVHLHGDFVVKNSIGKLALNLVILPQLRKTFDYVMDFEKDVERRPISRKTNRALYVNEERLSSLIMKLKSRYANGEMIDSLLDTILTASDDEVNGMKPYAWARQHGFDRQLAVELFLTATTVGILNQEWSLMCPNCRVPKGRTNSLKNLEKTVHCDLCGINFDLDFDKSIEMRFTVNTSIRETQTATFCVNGPMNSPHVQAQFRISAQSERKLVAPKSDQKLRWRILKSNETIEIDRSTSKDEETICFTSDGFEHIKVTNAKNIYFKNKTTKEVILVAEEVEWDQFALTARDVTSMQLFRDLFATEVLSTNQELSIGNITILFTDLKGSTQLYSTIGDAPAYSNVKKHFDYLTEIIKYNKGAIVKTIGDSVMAVFTEEAFAMKAAFQIQNNIAKLNSLLTQPLQVKIGFHSGPVIAVNANEILDYFGGTVNMAARIQAESEGGDIVLIKDMYDELLLQTEMNKLLAPLKVDHFVKQLSGIGEETRLVRIEVSSAE